MKKISISIITLVLLVISFILPSNVNAGKNSCRTPIAPTNLSIDSNSKLTWVNNYVPNTRESAYITVEKSSYISAENYYWSSLYHFWTNWTNISGKLSASTNQYTDTNPSTSYPSKYHVVITNSCGSSAVSGEIIK